MISILCQIFRYLIIYCRFDSTSDTLEISDQNPLPYQSTINLSSTDSDFDDSRTTQSGITPTSNNRSLINGTQERTYEVTILSNISATDT